MGSDDALIAEIQATADQEFDIVLTPISHPELGDIRIDDNLFAIGRTEAPFMSYPPEIIAELSRRHARIFSEYGAVYAADLDSKNGTTVNGVNIQQKISKLQHGDEICFGRTLSYRVQLNARAPSARRAAKLFSLTLTPERSDIALQPIVVTQFPFLISKADATFARYKEGYPHQVDYISRRHAHIFLKGGEPFVEDLGSTNGSFVGGKRLDEHAVALRDGDVLGFGGHHFVYKVSLQHEQAAADPTLTKFASTTQGASVPGVPNGAPGAGSPVAGTPVAGDPDKTTFVAAADSFLDIFCIDHPPPQDDALNKEEAAQSGDARKDADRRKPRSRFAVQLSEIAKAFAGGEGRDIRRVLRWGAVAAAGLVVIAVGLYLGGSSEREVKDLLARSEYAAAAAAAGKVLERSPDNTEVQALGTEALLKANVPQWLALLKSQDFDRADALLAGMKTLGAPNPDVQALVGDLAWMGKLERFVIGRGGADAPIRIYADEDPIKAILQRWDEDTQARQRAFDRIASHVPAFQEPYTEALSHLRKLHSDDAVYLSAVERLKTSIAAALSKDQPEELEDLLDEYAEKYPRLGGLDKLREDLQQYLAIDREARARKLGPLVALLAKAQLSTPPFQEQLRVLESSGRLPSAETVRQYQTVSTAWQEGNTQQALTGLQQMNAGPWADVAAKQLEHKKTVMEQFAELQKTRDAKGYDERLLSFYASLNPDEDVYFIKATETDVSGYRDKALKRAQELMTRAQAQWHRYRDNGAIAGAQRLEAGISNQFRRQARLLSEANEDAQNGMRIVTQLKAEHSEQWNKVRDEIKAEAALQRRSLLELHRVLEPDLLKQKLALLGERGNEE
ncbi:MAG: FHA domain-containing protein [Noviherbaspirillum sp.]